MRFGLLAACLALVIAASPAFAADSATGRYVEPAAPEQGLMLFRRFPKRPPLACDNPRVLAEIVERFAWAERNTWHRGYVMARLDQPRLRYDVFEGPSVIDHTHCQAEAIMTNGDVRTTYYIVEEGMGFASIGRGVTFCVLGLDPWYVYDYACRTLR